MGSYLTQPVTKKKINFQHSKSTKLRVFSCEMQGWRRKMEDSMIQSIDLGDGNSLFAVFDGHGGNQVSIFAEQNFENVLVTSLFYQNKKYPQALSYAFHKLDQMIGNDYGQIRLKQIRQQNQQKQNVQKLRQVESPKLKKVSSGFLSPKSASRKFFNTQITSPKGKRKASTPAFLDFNFENQVELASNDRSNVDDKPVQKVSLKTGCTAHVLLITKNRYFIANTGDSRSFLCRNNKAYPLSFDHKPDDPQELKRIKEAGFRVNGGRINGGLNLSRTLGDFCYKSVQGLPKSKQPIICTPQIRQVQRSKKDQFILIGCDGIFEKYYHDQQPLSDMIKKGFKTKKSGTQILTKIFDTIIAKDTSQILGCDNMSAILIELN